jgi:hypothetical protein
MDHRFALPLMLALAVLPAGTAPAADPWVITGAEVIAEPMEIGDVILVGDGSLTVTGVPEPGLRISGNVWALGSSQVRLIDSAIRFMSTFHGQYALAAVDNARVEVTGCDYRIPHGVQHGLVAGGDAEIIVEDSDFGDVQLLTVHTARIEAARLNGSFEVIVQNDSEMVLADIPRDPGSGDLCVWVEFPTGSVAEYTPPMPGFVDHWTFPPQDATGIVQTVSVERCQARLWPMLVREGSSLTLRDIPEDNWIVVGLHLFQPTTVENLINGTLYDDVRLAIGDHDLRLVNASIDTWNLYPQGSARVEVRDSWIGEILAMGGPLVTMQDTTVDGTGGFFGARDHSHVIATRCTVTSTVEATQDATIELHHSVVEPYAIDETGALTRFGAYDRALLYAHHTAVSTNPALGGEGVIAASYIADLPAEPPAAGTSVPLRGLVAVFSVSGDPGMAWWRIDAVSRVGGVRELIGDGNDNVEDDDLGTWHGSDPVVDRQLQVVLSDTRGRRMIGLYEVPSDGPHLRAGPPDDRRRAP